MTPPDPHPSFWHKLIFELFPDNIDERRKFTKSELYNRTSVLFDKKVRSDLHVILKFKDIEICNEQASVFPSPETLTKMRLLIE